MILASKPRPQFSWQFESEGVVRIHCQDLPAKVTLWQATNPNARDFRLESLGPQYKPTVLEGSNGEYMAKVDKPAKGWTAYFVELSYPSRWNSLSQVHHAARVIPDTLPVCRQDNSGTNVKAGQ